MGVLKVLQRQAEGPVNSTTVTSTTQQSTQFASSQASTQSFNLPTTSSEVVVFASSVSTVPSSTAVSSSSLFSSSTTSSASVLSTTFTSSTTSAISSASTFSSASSALSSFASLATSSDVDRISTSLDTTTSTFVRTTTSTVATTSSAVTESSTVTSTALGSATSISSAISSFTPSDDDREATSTASSTPSQQTSAAATSSALRQLSPSINPQASQSSSSAFTEAAQTSFTFVYPLTNVAIVSPSSSAQAASSLTSILQAPSSSSLALTTAPTASSTSNVNFRPNSDESQSRSNVPMIAGITSALGALMLALICGVIYIRHRSRKQSNAWRARLLRGRLFSTNPDPDLSSGDDSWQAHRRNISLPIQFEPRNEPMGTMTLAQPEAARLPVSVPRTGPLIDVESGYSGPGPGPPPSSMGMGISPTDLTDPFARGPLLVDNTRRTPSPDVWDWGPNLRPISIGRAL